MGGRTEWFHRENRGDKLLVLRVRLEVRTGWHRVDSLGMESWTIVDGLQVDMDTSAIASSIII